MAGSRVTYHKAGEDAEDLQIGDFLLTRGENRNARAIRFGQALEHGFSNPVRHVNHAVLCLGGNDTAEALADGIVESTVNLYRYTNYAIVRTGLIPHDQGQVFDYAYKCLTEKHEYGWLQVASISVRMLTGMKYFICRSESDICSGFVAGALRAGGFTWKYPPPMMTPADLALHFGVHLPSIT